jgi:hypothetical protein
LADVEPGCPVRPGQATTLMARRDGHFRTNLDLENGLHRATTALYPLSYDPDEFSLTRLSEEFNLYSFEISVLLSCSLNYSS